MSYKNPHYHRDYFRAQGEKRKAYLRARYVADPAKQRAASAKYIRTPAGLAKRKAAENTPEAKSKRAAWRKAHPEQVRLYARKQRLKKHNATPLWWDNQFGLQQGRCTICAQSFDLQKPQTINIDHDHKTGNLRSLLCNKCNTGLGAFDDNPTLLTNAIAYLAQYAEPQT